MKKVTTHFTLMELLVAMGVFCILLVIMMQFFSSARNVTSAAEKKSKVYSQTRNALDMISSLLQNSTPSSDNSEKSKEESGDTQWTGAPFFLRSYTNYSDYTGQAIIFPTYSPYRFAGQSNLMYVGIFGPNMKTGSSDSGEIRLAVISDDQARYANIWPPLNAESSATDSTEGALKYLKKHVPDDLLNFRNSTEESSDKDKFKYRFVLLKNVVSFNFAAYKLQREDNKANQKIYKIDSSSYEDRLKRPYAIELQISVLNEDDYIRYREMLAAGNPNADNFCKENQHTFNRYIFLNSRPEE